MKIISATLACEHSDRFEKEFDALKDGEQFIYADLPFEFFSIKINNDYAAQINADGKFFLNRKYKNCLLIEGAFVKEYDSFAEAEEAAKKAITLTQSDAEDEDDE